jgi:hypothetical protein
MHRAYVLPALGLFVRYLQAARGIGLQQIQANLHHLLPRVPV